MVWMEQEQGTPQIASGYMASQVSALVTELQRCYSLLGEEFNINGHINPPLIRAIVGGKSLKVYKEETKETVSSK
jgi:hypothetical protein